VEIRPVFGRCAGGVDARAVEYSGHFVFQQAAVSGLWVKAKQQSRLGDEVDVVFQFVGDAAVPHRDGENVFVRIGKTPGDRDDLVPGRLAAFVHFAHAKECHLGCGFVAVEFGQVCVPKINDIYFDVGLMGFACRKIGLCQF